MPLPHPPEGMGAHGPEPFAEVEPIFAAKVEYCRSTFSSPQPGHATAGELLRTSFSNWPPQASHRYS